jgi:selenocysteine lyase/cysteine desulfurase
VLGNSTSYGLHLIANGLMWADGDEVLTVDGDYPATVLPWQRLASRGVKVRRLAPPARC